MTFTSDTFGVLTQTIGGDFHIHNYRSDDSPATVEGDGYFTDARRFGVNPGDLIFVSPLSPESTESYIAVVESMDANGHATVSLNAGMGADIHLKPHGGGGAADYERIQGVIDRLTERGEGSLRMSGTFEINQGLVVGTGLRILGEGAGSDTTTSSQPGPTARTRWVWTGGVAPSATMLRVAAAGKWIWDFYMDGINLTGADSCGRLLHISSTKYTRLGRLFLERCTVCALEWDGASIAGGHTGGWDELWITMGSNAACQNADGIRILSVATHFFCGRTTLDMIDGDGLIIGDCDQSVFDIVEAGASGTGRGLVFGGMGAETVGAEFSQVRPSRKCVVHNAHGRIFAEPQSRNSITDLVNSESSRVVVAPGAVLCYGVIDRDTGEFWYNTPKPFKGAIHLQPKMGDAVLGTPAIALIGTSGGGNTQRRSGISFADAADGEWQWEIGRSRPITGVISQNWSRFVGVEMTGIKVDATVATGNVVLRVTFDQKGDTALLSGAYDYQQTFTQATEAARAVDSQTPDYITYTLTNPVAAGKNTGFIFRIGRLGTDAADTFTGAYAIIGEPTLLFLNDPAPGDNTNRYSRTITGSGTTVTITTNQLNTPFAALPHSFLNGETVRISSVLGSIAALLEGKFFTVSGVSSATPNTFTITGVAGVDGLTSDPTDNAIIEPVNKFQVSSDTI